MFLNRLSVSLNYFLLGIIQVLKRFFKLLLKLAIIITQFSLRYFQLVNLIEHLILLALSTLIVLLEIKHLLLQQCYLLRRVSVV
jgi:hypothetical protein